MKAVGVLIIALGLILVVIGVQGSQHNVLQTLKGINPVLRKQTGTANSQQNAPAATTTSSGGNPQVTLV